MTEDTNSAKPPFSIAQYRQLADLRFHIRRYLQFSEHVARTHSIEPQQHQLMLTIKGLPPDTNPTVSALANRLCLRHHSTVELINRLVERGAAVRKPCTQDRRQVLVELTPQGEELLAELTAHHDQELQTFAPELVAKLTATLAAISAAAETQAESDQPTAIHSDTDSDLSTPPKFDTATAKSS